MYPNNQYKNLIDEKLNNSTLKNFKRFIYSPNPEVLTGEIEILTNYSQKKNNLKIRKKLEDKEDEQSIKELERLDQLYTLGEVNFDSVIIIDFGNSLKSVLTSLVYSNVDQNRVLFTTINQWFDESIFMRIQLKIFITHQLIFQNLKNIIKLIIENSANTPMKLQFYHMMH